jgi:hypothetical protein
MMDEESSLMPAQPVPQAMPSAAGFGDGGWGAAAPTAQLPWSAPPQLAAPQPPWGNAPPPPAFAAAPFAPAGGAAPPPRWESAGPDPFAAQPQWTAPPAFNATQPPALNTPSAFSSGGNGVFAPSDPFGGASGLAPSGDAPAARGMFVVDSYAPHEPFAAQPQWHAPPASTAPQPPALNAPSAFSGERADGGNGPFAPSDPFGGAAVLAPGGGASTATGAVDAVGDPFAVAGGQAAPTEPAAVAIGDPFAEVVPVPTGGDSDITGNPFDGGDDLR